MIKNSIRIFVIFLNFWLFSINPGFSEILHLKSGEKVEGKITIQTDEKVSLDPGFGMSVTYYTDEIDNIEFIETISQKTEVKKITKKYPNRYTPINGKFVPPDDQVLLIVGQDKNTIINYLDDIDVVPGGFTVYTSIQKMDGIYRPVNHGGGVQHAQYLVDNYPNSTIQIGLYMVGGLDKVIRGKYDRNIKKLGEWFLKNSDRPFFLRIGYEFDNPENKYKPVKYVNVYKYIAMRLQMMGVRNVAYVWHSYASLAKYPPMDWYPGDEYVDWIAISYFNPYNTEGMNKIAKIARERNKPLMIAESTPIKMSTYKGEYTWKRWFSFVFDYIKENNVKAFSYINCDWDAMPLFIKDQWGDARIEANPIIKKNWLNTIQNDEFLKASPDLFKKLRFE